MVDLKAIKENYTRMPLSMLKKTAKKPEKLHKEVVLILQKELDKRGEVEDAAFLADFILEKDEKSIIQKMSKEELRQLVKERLDSGELKESVMCFLKENNISLFDISEVPKDENKAIRKELFRMKALAVLHFLAIFSTFNMFNRGRLNGDTIPLILISSVINIFFGLGLWFKRKKIFYTGVVLFGLLHLMLLVSGQWNIIFLLTFIGLGYAMSFVKYMK